MIPPQLKPHGLYQSTPQSRKVEPIGNLTEPCLRHFVNDVHLVTGHQRQHRRRRPQHQRGSRKERAAANFVFPRGIRPDPSTRCRQPFRQLHAFRKVVADVFRKREDVVAGPIEHQAARGIVQKHQEQRRHRVELVLIFLREVLRVHQGGREVDHRHYKRHHVHGEAAQVNQPVGFGKIGEPQKRYPGQRFEVT